MNRLTRFLNLKTIAVFALTILIGFWASGFFERYVFNFYFVESFSDSEAQNLIGKRIQDTCSIGENFERQGEVFGYYKGDFGDIYIQVKWEGKVEGLIVNSPKGCFKQCMKVVNPE